MASSSLWQRFQQNFLRYDDLDLSIDVSRMKFPADFFEEMRPKIDKAFAAPNARDAAGTNVVLRRERLRREGDGDSATIRALSLTKTKKQRTTNFRYRNSICLSSR